jgi:hypothetical protein
VTASGNVSPVAADGLLVANHVTKSSQALFASTNLLLLGLLRHSNNVVGSA